MVVYKCKMCGGNLEIDESTSVITCEYCGSQQTISTTRDEIVINLYNRANNLRSKSEFDNAREVYEKILNIDNTQAEAHWGIVLCKYGVEYVTDYGSELRVPTCHRTEIQSILTDIDYLATLENADSSARIIYEKEALKISDLQKNILQIVNNEKPFDVFICYKETDESSEHTKDSVIASEIYHRLTDEGFKVFYSAITLENILGQEYEPYIFAALTSARVMLVVGTKPEYLNAVWVRNEWSRYLHFMKTDKKKTLIPCYRDMDAYDLPEDFSHLQALDMSKIGFLIDLTRGIKKLLSDNTSTGLKRDDSHPISPLLKRAFMSLEDGDFEDADKFLEEVLNQDPENAKAYIGKMLAQCHLNHESDLAKSLTSLTENKYFNKAVKFANRDYKNQLSSYSEIVEIQILERKYQTALDFKSENTVDSYQKAADLFSAISEYKDAEEQARECRDLVAETEHENINNFEAYQRSATFFSAISEYKDAEEQARECRGLAVETEEGEAIYNEALDLTSKKTVDAYQKAANLFSEISGYKDAQEQARKCRGLAVETENKTIYNEALNRKSEKTVDAYQKAAILFSTISGYKDAEDQSRQCRDLAVETENENIYNKALDLKSKKTVGSYQKAECLFSEISGYKDAAEKARKCHYSAQHIKNMRRVGNVFTVFLPILVLCFLGLGYYFYNGIIIILVIIFAIGAIIFVIHFMDKYQ
ncbi:MAG: TIR domain-containing protein [Acholeplasmataceae bacterium]|nr:TIR domain-containing protein [Acholeplasmataceae bacterium]